MSDLVITKQSSALPMSAEQADILKKTLFKGFTDDEVAFSMAVCSRTGLDPFVRQIHFTKRKNRKTNEETIVITTGIDGFRLTANRTGAYAGSDAPVFEGDDKGLISASVTVWKIVAGQRYAFTAKVYWDEYYPGDPEGFMWRKMPRTMLSKCAEALALRKAFPAELSGVYSHEEMQQASSAREVNPAAAKKAKELTESVQATEAKPEFEASSYFEADPEPQELGIGDTIFNVGKKNKGKKLRQIPLKELAEFVDWAKGQGELTEEAQDCADRVRQFLEENSMKETNGPE